MATIADVLSNYRNNMPSPAGSFADAYQKSSVAAGATRVASDKNRILEQARQDKLAETAGKTKAVQEKAAQDKNAALAKRRAGTAMYLVQRAEANPEQAQQEWAAIQKNDPELIPVDVPFEAAQQFIAQNIQAGDAMTLGKAEFEKKYKQKAQTETARHNKAMEQKKSGMQVYDAEGNLIVSTGSQPAGKKLTNQLQKETFNAQEALARYRGIKDVYKPEYLTLSGKTKQWLANAKDFMGGEEWLSDEDRKVIDESTKMFRRTAETLSLFIKDISGAAVSEQEAKRLSKALPTTGDRPREYKAKLDDIMDQVNASLWRRNYAMSKGLDPLNSKVSLYDMDSIIESEGKDAELAARKQNPGASDQEIDAMVAQQLTSVFGSLE